jgi:hypothetical protein
MVTATASEEAKVAPTSVSTTSQFHWREIESEDYPIYIANLRAVGCPEKTIRDIILADLEKLYEPRIEDVERMPTGRFWRTAEKRERAEREKDRRARELKREKRELIKALLGLDYDLKDLEIWYDEKEVGMLLGLLADPKPVQVIALGREAGELIEVIDHEAGGILTPEDVALKKQLFDRMLMDLGRNLTPFELEEIELRVVGVAGFLFNDEKPRGFPMTGREFRELVRLKKLYDHPLVEEFEWPDEAAEKRREDAKKAFESAVKAMFGDKRYAEYARARDPAFDAIHAIAVRNGVPAHSAIKAYEITKAVAAETTRLRRDRVLTEEQREARLQEARLAAAHALRQTLGEKALADYRKEGAPKWLRLEKQQ